MPARMVTRLTLAVHVDSNAGSSRHLLAHTLLPPPSSSRPGSVQSKQREELAEFAEIEHRAATDVSAQLTAQLETAQREVP